jgi:predicted phosphodiesterase
MKVNHYIKVLLVAALGMLILVSLLGSMDILVGAFEVRVSLSFFDHGFTQLEIPPLGRVWAQTHVPPLKLTVFLKNINIDMLREDLVRLPEPDLVDSIVRETRSSLIVFVVRLLSLAFLGGAAGVYFLFSKENKSVLVGGVMGFLILSLLLFSLYISYDADAFLTPQYEGALAAAPWAFGLLEETLAKVTTLGEQLEVIASSVYLLFERIEFLEPLGLVEGERKILHVSDIHNNPAAFNFIEQVVRSFTVDFIIDTGDISDFGTPLEAELALRVGALGVPYIFIPGNHDSPDIVNTLAALPGVFVLEVGSVEVAQVRVAGIRDPSSLSTAMAVPSDAVLDGYARSLQEYIEESGVLPDIVAAHHPRIVSRFIGLVPILLTGHTHSMDISQVEGSVIINAGTTGAAGIRGLQAAREVPFSLVLLHLNRNTRDDWGWKLTATDTIKVFQFQSGFSLSRTLYFDNGVEDGVENEGLDEVE